MLIDSTGAKRWPLAEFCGRIAVNLRPSRVLVIDGVAHAFGRLDRPDRVEFRLSSPALEIAKDGATHIRTRSRTYICAGQDAVLSPGASAQLREFLSAWEIPAEQ